MYGDVELALALSEDWSLVFGFGFLLFFFVVLVLVMVVRLVVNVHVSTRVVVATKLGATGSVEVVTGQVYLLKGLVERVICVIVFGLLVVATSLLGGKDTLKGGEL